MRVLKLENNIVVNVEMHDELPDNVGNFIYKEAVDWVGIGWEFKDSYWLNPVDMPRNVKTCDLNGNPIITLDSNGQDPATIVDEDGA